MSNSDIMINLRYSADTAQSKTPAGNKKRKNRCFRKRMQYLERKGYLEGKHKPNCEEGRSRCDQAVPRQNGASQEHPSRPASTVDKQTHLSSTAGSSRFNSLPSTSTRSLPSSTATAGSKGSTPSAFGGHKPTATKVQTGIPSKCLAIDCEMVGTGPKGRVSQLARCSIVSHDGDVVYDKFINPPVPVTDYRSRWSGIRPRDLVNATPYSEARKEILKLLIGKVVIGHAVHNDFKVLGYSHPAAWTRDTSRSPLLNVKAGLALTECASLKRLTKAIFNRDIQTGKRGHSSVEDAKATMELYKVVEEEWEGQLASKSQAS